MSYEKVRSIKIKDGKVFINCASNNCRPLSYSEEEYPYFTKILNEKGLIAVEVELLKNYESGNLQDGINKYSKALKVLRYVFGEEYFKFNWRNHNAKWGTPEKEAEDNLRKSPLFDELLKKCLNYKLPKEKFVISKKHYDGTTIYGKKCLTCMKWKRTKKEATKYDFKKEAEDNIYNSFKDDWEVEVLK